MDRLIQRGRRLAFPISIGLLSLIMISLGLVYFQQMRQQQSLQDETTSIKRIVAQGRTSQEVTEKYQALHAVIPGQDLAQTDVYEILLAEAVKAGVKLSINFKTATVRSVLGTSYRVMPFSMTAKGDYEAVRGFVESIENGETGLQTLVLESVTIGHGEEASASVDIVVYTQASGGKGS